MNTVFGWRRQTISLSCLVLKTLVSRSSCGKVQTRQLRFDGNAVVNVWYLGRLQYESTFSGVRWLFGALKQVGKFACVVSFNLSPSISL